MKVLLVHNRYRSSQPSGENAVVDYEAGLLAEHGCDVERLEADSDEIADWSALRRVTLPARVVWSRDGAGAVRDAVSRFRPDVVHFHNTFPLFSPAAIRAAKSAGAPVVMTFHNFRPLCAAGAFIRDGQVCEDCLHRRAPVAALRYGCYRGSRTASVPLVAMSAVHRALGTWTDCVDVILFPSDFARQKYVAAGWPAHKCIVKYNTAPDAGRTREGAGDGFVVVSRLSEEKGVDVLIDAWRDAFPSGGARLSIIGSGEDGEELQRRAAGLEGVEFLGRLPHAEALAHIATARAVVVPSRCNEVFGRVVAEAYSVGVPVIASRVGALAEIVVDERTGLHVEPGSRASVAQALQRLDADPAEAETFGHAARRAYDERYGPEATMAVLVDAYSRASGDVLAIEGRAREGAPA